MVDKAINVKIKASFQPPLGIKKTDFRYLKGYKLAKKDKNKANQDYKNKNKST